MILYHALYNHIATVKTFYILRAMYWQRKRAYNAGSTPLNKLFQYILYMYNFFYLPFVLHKLSNFNALGRDREFPAYDSAVYAAQINQRPQNHGRGTVLTRRNVFRI